MMALRLVLFLSLLLGPSLAQEPLLPYMVSQSARTHYPAVLAAEAERRSAEGSLLSARGSFDTRVESEARARLEGFYSGDILTTTVKRPLGPLGAEVYGGYRISDGDFPTYEDYYFTNRAGEGKIGILFSLLRDRSIDARRFGVAQAELGLELAELDLLLTRINVQREALIAYWRWVAAGRELAAYRSLLTLAEERDRALRREVASGARAEIFLTENAQNLTRRRELVRQAERDLALAANRLSLFLRSDDGTPIIPDPDRLPESFPLTPAVPSADAYATLAMRPELRALALERDLAENERRLARNDLQPRLDARIEALNDFGDIGPGGASRDPAELVAGVTLSVPIGRREARGRLRSAEAEIEALEQQRRLLRDRIEQELSDIIITLNTARDVLALSRQEVEQASIMARSENELFRGGASDIFRINLREEALADSRVRLARAEFALASADVTYRAAVLDIDSLGLGER
ncbi:TolC family protein [Parvularcula lutaonensis]|uniref:TolC family protein n=1 Tax=Parvularcula lutaonensis TaxID=491923 RepID=A0ABV7M8U5_9PROT|nr:TolC family protein [Parvularcula lutaonensis]GGY56999.1 multidrug transporter [Parvularcula lutaonensis]